MIDIILTERVAGWGPNKRDHRPYPRLADSVIIQKIPEEMFANHHNQIEKILNDQRVSLSTFAALQSPSVLIENSFDCGKLATIFLDIFSTDEVIPS